MADNMCNMSKEQISEKFGSDELMRICKNCDSLVYENGIMTCKKCDDTNNT